MTKNKVPTTGDEHSAFRRTKKWKTFRLEMLKDRGSKCEVCGSKASGLNVHHTDEENYYNLDKDLFILLCKSCHRELHRLMRRKVFDIDIYLVAFRDTFKRSKK